MKLETVLMILKYAGTIIAGILAIIGTKIEKSDSTANNPSSINPAPGWKKWTLLLAVLSLLVALASQIAEQKINDQESATLTARLRQLQAQAALNQKNNSKHLDEILSWLAQMDARSASRTNIISQTIQVFQQFAVTLTNSPSSDISQKATNIIEQISRDQQKWIDNQSSAADLMPVISSTPTDATPKTNPTPVLNFVHKANPAPVVNPAPGTNAPPIANPVPGTNPPAVTDPVPGTNATPGTNAPKVLPPSGLFIKSVSPEH